MITIFSAPKPFEGHIDLIQRNAIRSWKALAPTVQVLVIGEEKGARQVCEELGVEFVPGVERNELGTPLLSSIFQLAALRANFELMCYVNADILLTPSLLAGADTVASRYEQFLVVGQRWNIEIAGEIDLERLRGIKLNKWLATDGQLHKPSGSDYFVYRRGMYHSGIPKFALGRSGWDNWMIYSARSRGLPVIDASEAITVVHQNHDYAHLPGGRSHYDLPESKNNVRLAGGPETVFTLKDATHRIIHGEVKRIGAIDRGVVRSMEASLYAHMREGRLRRLVRMIFHPIQAVRFILWRVKSNFGLAQKKGISEDRSA